MTTDYILKDMFTFDGKCFKAINVRAFNIKHIFVDYIILLKRTENESLSKGGFKKEQS
jgi:hypothetical protein